MQKYKKDSKEPFVKLDYSMINSAAWRSLSSGAIWCYVELKKNFSIGKGGSVRFTLPYRKILFHEANSTISKNIKELLAMGFIDYLERGGLFKKMSLFRLSDRWKKISGEILAKEAKRDLKKR